MSRYYSFFPPYVSVAERRRKAEAAAKKLAKGGQTLAPVQLTGRNIAATFWGKSWCDNLESYSDYSNRLPRGRTYVRNGSVLDLQIAHGKIEALVQGSNLYKISITIRPLDAKRWQEFKRACSGKLTNLLDLLQGRLSKEILTDITARATGLFPSPQEITLKCSCPDWADMCKHVAAVLYGIGARLDTKPELFFTLRGVDMQELITAASATAVAPMPDASASGGALAGADLGEIFGVDIETGNEPPTAAPKIVPASKPSGKTPDVSPRKRARKLPATPVKALSKKGASRRAKKTQPASASSRKTKAKPRR